MLIGFVSVVLIGCKFTSKCFNFLKLLSDYEVELTLAAGGVVETVTPVDTEQAYHRQEDTHAYTGAPLDLQRIEIAYVGPAVAAFQEEQGEDGGRRLEYNGIAEFHGELVVDVAGICRAARVVTGFAVRCERIVLISAERYDVGSVGSISAHAVAAHHEAFERGIAPSAVVIAEVSELGPGHEHQVASELGVIGRREFPFMVLDPLETLLRGPVVVIDIGGLVDLDDVPAGVIRLPAEEREWRGDLQREAEFGALAGIYLLVGTVAHEV